MPLRNSAQFTIFTYTHKKNCAASSCPLHGSQQRHTGWCDDIITSNSMRQCSAPRTPSSWFDKETLGEVIMFICCFLSVLAEYAVGNLQELDFVLPIEFMMIPWCKLTCCGFKINTSISKQKLSAAHGQNLVEFHLLNLSVEERYITAISHKLYVTATQ